MTERRGDWMQTYTGRRFWPLSPVPEDIDPLDIAHGLAFICRYGGHVTRFYSVAEHCVLMSEAVSPENALAALLHDAAEAYIGDMVRPLKKFMPEFQAVDHKLECVVRERFGLPDWPDWPAEVKEADNRIVRSEKEALLANPERWFVDDLEYLPVRIQGWQPAQAEAMYLDRMWELGIRW